MRQPLPTSFFDRVMFHPLPVAGKAGGGGPRCVGVEIEFAGLDEEATADLIQSELGGEKEAAGRMEWRVTGSELGEVSVLRDSAYRKLDSPLAEKSLRLAGALVPVEIVTAPLDPVALPRLARLVDALVAAGAYGSQAGVFLGYGLHLNVEVAGERAADILPIVRAYGWLEDWLRQVNPIDSSRRILPFVDPWPRGFLDALADPTLHSTSGLIDAYLGHSPSRNRGLDLLPLFRHLDPDRLSDYGEAGGTVAARPAFHYRLPDSRLGDPQWSLAFEWNRWQLVERVAADGDLLSALGHEWDRHRHSLTTTRLDWAPVVDQLLKAHLFKETS